MFKNYVKIALRNILRHKGYSFVNITGLAIGLASCLLITLWIINELSYDKFHKEGQNIYQVLGQGITKNFQNLPIPLAPALEAELPEITYATRYDYFQEVLLNHKNFSFYEDRIVMVDKSFFNIFTFSFLKGDKNSALRGPDSIVISEKIAKKYFSHENPIGKALTMDNQHDFVVTGVMKNIPSNSSLQFDMVIMYENITFSRDLDWNQFSPRTFIKLLPNCSPEEINKKISNFIPSHKEGLDVGLSILPFTKRYIFFSGIVKYIYIFSVIAFFILIIACINFINLSTARSVNRAQEISIRKVTGACREHIIWQFLGESLVLSSIALLFALALVSTLLPVFNMLIGKKIMFNHEMLLPILIGLTVFTGIIAGSYPALFLSAFQPVKVLKGSLKSGSRGFFLRKLLVVIQFAVSIFLIISTGIVHKQLGFFKNKDMGYDKQHIIKISMKGDSNKKYNIFKSELLSNQNILGVTGMMDDLPDFGWNTAGINWERKDPSKKILTSYNYVDYDFTETLNIEMIEGRHFSKEYPSDVVKNFLVNEEMLKTMGLDSAASARLTLWGRTGNIVGVMKNFHFQPLHSKISPLVLLLYPKELKNILVKISSDDIAQSLEFIRKTWRKIIPVYPFEYQFLDEDFDRRYEGIKRVGQLANIFSILAILISCLGLFGLASFTAEQRTKEIGVRKILGATVPEVVSLMSKNFIKLVAFANIIAWPLSYLFMKNWLENFAYRTRLNITTFIISGLLALAIALITVSYQSIKAATANPVDSLRYE